MRLPRAGFTTRASCLLAAGATALLCGVALGVVDLVRAGCFALAVPIVSAIVVQRARVTISSRRRTDLAAPDGMGQVGIHLTVTNRSVLPSGALMLEDRLPDRLTGKARFVLDGLAGRESRTVAYLMPPLPRGRYTAGPLRMRVVDPFGLIDLTRSFTAVSAFVVPPIVERLPAVAPPVSFDVGENVGSHSVGSHGADDASTREYRRGDDLRKIHWRSTARTGALMVRHEERPWQGQTTLVLDLRAGAHEATQGAGTAAAGTAREESSLEWAVSAVASIGSHLAMLGREVGLLDDVARPERARFASTAALVDHLADVTPTAAVSLGGLTTQLRAAGRDSTMIAVLGRLDATSVRTLTDAHPRGSSVPAFAILLQVERWTGADQPAAGPAAEWTTTAAALRAAGWWVVPAERGASVGEVWTRLLAQRSGARSAGVARLEPVLE